MLSLPLLAGDPPPAPAAPAEPSAVVEVTAPLPVEPLVTVLDPRGPRQPVPAHDGADALKTVPGFAVVRKGGTDGDPVLRGMAGSRLLMILDGEQILGGCGNRMDPPTAYVFPESYDRVTVVKGPQTVLYGPGNSAGVVRFERSHARLAQAGAEGFASLLGGSAGRSDAIAEVKGGTPAFYLRGSGSRSHSDDYADGDGMVIHSRATRWSANLAAGWTPSDDVLVELTSTRSDGEAAYADRSVDGTRFLRENLGLKAEFRRVAPWLERVEVQGYRNDVDHVMDNFSLRTFTATPMSPEPSLMNPDRRTTGGRILGEFRFGAGTQASLGIDGQSNRHTIRKTMRQWTMPAEAMPRNPDGRFRNTGVFGELRYAQSDRNRLIGGLRFDRWHAEDPRATVATSMMASAPNPTAQAERDETLGSGFLRFERTLGSAATFYVGLGRSTRFPDYWEAIAKESLGSVSAFLTRPERTTQLDLGWTRQSGAVQGSVALFVSRVDDFILIQSGVVKPAGMGTRLATVSRNVEAATFGGEAALATRFEGGFRADASVAWTRGQNRTDDLPLAQIPPLEGRLGLAWQGGPWSAGLLLRGVARQDRVAVNQGSIVGQDLGVTPGFGVLSLNVGWTPARGWLFTAGVDNLADRTYAEAVNRGASLVPGYELQSVRVNEPGRTLWAKATWRFGGCH